MIYASVPVLQPPDRMRDTAYAWNGCGPELLVVDNTDAGEWADEAKLHGWSYLHFGKNLGVPASWNVARAKFLADTAREYDLLLLFSASVRFDDGLPAVLDRLAMEANWKGCQTQLGFHAIAWSRTILETTGTFDETFWPGYYSDNDYAYRGILDGWLLAGPDAMPNIEVNAPETPGGRAITQTGLLSYSAACLQLYATKWGGEPSHEKYTTPFDSGLPTSWWSPCHRPWMQNVNLGESRYR